MNTDERGLDSLTERVLGAVFEVSNTLGAGFLEKVYERALLTELGLRGIRATAQASFPMTSTGRGKVIRSFARLVVASRFGRAMLAPFQVFLPEASISRSSPVSGSRNFQKVHPLVCGNGRPGGAPITDLRAIPPAVERESQDSPLTVTVPSF